MTNPTRNNGKSLEEVEKELEPKPTGDKRDAPKTLEAVREEEGLYIIRYTAGGEVPDSCKGKFTNLRFADAAIAEVLKLKAA